MDIFKTRLSQLIEEKNIDQKEVAEKTGITEATISRYITGKMKPTMRNAQILANYFGVSIDYLSGETSLKASLTAKDERDIAKKLSSILDEMNNNADALMFDGEKVEMDEESKELLRVSIENSLRLAKKLAKEKYTPKKYRE